MPFTLQWLNEDEDILVVTYSGRWTWEEVQEVDVLSRALYTAANKRVDCICDMMDSRWVPPRYVENVRSVSTEPYPNLKLVVYVVQPMMRDLITTFDSSFEKLPYEIDFADDSEAAFLRILRSRGISERP